MGVEESWAAITAWLAEKVPRAWADLRPPASEDDIAAVEAEVGSRLPDELRAWLRLNDGMVYGAAFGRLIPPGHNPISCEAMVAAWRLWRSIDAKLHPEASRDPEVLLADAETTSAGSPSYDFLPTFVPFAADGSGTHLVVDLRAGELNGCVGPWDPEAGGFGRPLWPGVGAMLADVARSVTTGVPVLGSYDGRRSADRLGPMEPELFYEDDEWFHWE